VSVAVSLEQLRTEVARFGPSPYLLTVSDDGRPHATAVTVGWDGDRLRAEVGRKSAANAASRPDVTLLWSPVDDERFSLIVDGNAVVEEQVVTVMPAKAILHRQRADGPGSDCRVLEA
jgi:hypothetical protein